MGIGLSIAFAYIMWFWLIKPFIEGFKNPEIVVVDEPEPTIIEEEQVTVGDMVMHDMMNDNDAYDIGVIDFND